MSIFGINNDTPEAPAAPETVFDTIDPRQVALSELEALFGDDLWPVVHNDVCRLIDNLVDRSRSSAAPPRFHFSDAEIESIRVSRSNGTSVISLARKYAVSSSAITNICSAKTYPDAPGPIKGHDYVKPPSRKRPYLKGSRTIRDLSDAEVASIRDQAANGLPQFKIAQNFDIGTNAVGRIVRMEARK